MFAEDILAVLRKRPFVPFRIHAHGGLTYDIHHPDCVLVTVGATHIGTRRGVSDVPDKVDILSNQQIIRLEELAATAKQPPAV